MEKKFKFPKDFRDFPNEKVGIEKIGWYMHYVPSGDGTPFGANAHTHGFAENYDHPDIQICVPVDPKIMHSIFWTVFNDFISKGIKLKPGKYYNGIIQNYNMLALEAEECDRQVIRLCVPDAQGEYKGEYGKQLTMLKHKTEDE
jgi:hypothetical protein